MLGYFDVFTILVQILRALAWARLLISQFSVVCDLISVFCDLHAHREARLRLVGLPQGPQLRNGDAVLHPNTLLNLFKKKMYFSCHFPILT